MFRTSLTRHLVLTLCIALAACSPRKQEAVATAPIGAANVDAARIINADSEPGSWMSHGRTYSEQRFSPLDSISKTNVTRRTSIIAPVYRRSGLAVCVGAIALSQLGRQRRFQHDLRLLSTCPVCQPVNGTFLHRPFGRCS